MTDKIKDIITELQKELVAQGYKPGKVDGLMGALTFQAVRKHQNKPKAPVPTIPLLVPTPTRPPQSSSWRLARSLNVLRAQIDTAFPNRDRSSDGTIGDAVHATTKSDHNPWVIAANGDRVVTALDITNDPANGVYCSVLASSIITDPRVKYVIWDGRIFNAKISNKWRKYTGDNKHDKHVHISVKSVESLFDDEDKWSLDD